MGVEAGDQYIRNEVYEKNLTDEEIKEAFKICKKQEIGFTAFYILGGPGETKQTLQKTLDLAIELDGNRSAFFIFKPFTEESIKLIEKFGGYVDEQRIAKADNITFDA